jgi:membrane associated rhomboid family serine protease
MGIYDRDYVRERPRGGFGDFYFASLTTWLIVINVAVFFADGILLRMTTRPARHDAARRDDEGFDPRLDPEFAPAFYPPIGPLTRWGSFSADTAVRGGQVWRVLTFQLLHASGIHLVMNMLGIFFFGPIVEAHFGGRRYLAFYLLCGLAGALSFLVLSALHVVVSSPATPLVGASAGVFGLLLAASLIAPDVEVFYYFIPVTIRILAWASMGLAAYTVLATGFNAGGQAAHLGGGVVGFLLMKNQHWLNPFAPPRAVATVRPTVRPGIRRDRRRSFQKDWSKDLNR